MELISYTAEWNVSCRCTDLRKSFSRSPAVGSIRQRKSSYCNADCEVCSNWVKSFLFPSFQETSKLAELSFCSLLLCSLGVLWKRTLLVTLCSMEIASVLTAREPGPFKKMPPSLTAACKDALTGQGWAPLSDNRSICLNIGVLQNLRAFCDTKYVSEMIFSVYCSNIWCTGGQKIMQKSQY